MFGSNNNNPFGQSTSSPFGSQPAFGQTNNANNNPFAPKPFGSPTPFGAQTGSSIFGSTSTGVFGQTSSPLTQTPSFGASSSPAFGSSTPAFGASSTPAFGSTPVFGQKPAFGGFGSSTTQTSPFGGTFQQSQPAFGSSLFGSSTPFGASSQPAFGGSSTPAFGGTSSPAFGGTSSPAFGTSSTPAFGSNPTPAFGSKGSAFGVSNAPLFGSGGAFGTSSTPAFGTSSTPAFGTSSTPAFGAPSASGFSFGSSPSFGQTTAAFGSGGFGTSPSPFGASSSAFGGGQSTTPAFSSGFGQPAFGGGQRGGTRIAAYTPTAEADSSSNAPTKLESISAMPVYKEKSHEELRWEDYQLGDKGGPAPAGQATAATGFGASPPQSNNMFGGSTTFGQSSSSPFTSTTPTNPNPFASKPSAFGSTGFATSTSAFGSSPFGSSPNSNPFGANSSSSLFGGSTPAFGASSSSSLFNTTNTSAFGTPSIFSSTPASGTAPAFSTGLSFGNTQTSGLFQSSTPALGQTNSVFGQTAPPFGQGSSAFGQQNMFNTPSSGFGASNLFQSTSSLISSSNSMGFGQSTPALSTPFQSAQSAPATGSFGFGNFGQAQTAGAGGFGGTPSIFGQSTFGQASAPQSAAVAQPLPVTNPFGTLPAMPQISIGRSGASPSIQYGISSLPVVDRPSPVRVSSLLTSRHISQRRMRLPARKYNPKNDGPKVAFFNDDEETPSTPKADALFIPRENPRALVIRPLEHWPLRTNSEKSPPSTGSPTVVHTNGKISEAVSNSLNGSRPEDKERDLTENGIVKEKLNTAKANHKSNGVHDDHSNPKADSYITLTGHRAGEAAIVYEHGADVEALMPKLRHSDYYTEPRIQELAAKERAEPGYCRRVANFVVGRHGYGSIRFFGETDVRRLDLETLVQFNNKEVIVYSDESKKPPIGQGLNKPAEVTLLNIKCPNKKTGGFFTEGPRVERYKDMLIRKAEDQGAEFVSFDPVKGEWKFRVQHFSVYMLGDDNDDDDDEDF